MDKTKPLAWPQQDGKKQALSELSAAQRKQALEDLEQRYRKLQTLGLQLDLTRGKPGVEQLQLSDSLDGILAGDYHSDGVDTRNYGGDLGGLPGLRRLCGQLLQMPWEEILVGGNSSLFLQHQFVLCGLHLGVQGRETAWTQGGAELKFLCPVPGYDRHFTICERLGIAMESVPMDEEGPDMEQVEARIAADDTIRGIWCVPRFSNPGGQVYSERVVERMARLGQRAHPHFRVFWDNAYTVHAFKENAPQLAPIWEFCRHYGTEDQVLQFGSTSKMSFAAGGVGFVGASQENLRWFRHYLGGAIISFDKVNQLRQLRFLRDPATVQAHMAQHAALLRPRFALIQQSLKEQLEGAGVGSWSNPAGGYFVCFTTLDKQASEVVRLSLEAGVRLTPAASLFPYGKNPQDNMLRIAPTYPPLQELSQAMEVFTTSVLLAALRQAR